MQSWPIYAAAAWALLGERPGGARAQSEPHSVIVNEHYRLPNGLRVILSRDARAPRVALSVWYRAGLRHEPNTQPGLLSLVERAMFSGSKHVGDGEHLARLRRAGATDVGAKLGLDYSSYHETVPSNYLEMALWLESDRMHSLQAATLSEPSSLPERTLFGDAVSALPSATSSKLRSPKSLAARTHPRPGASARSSLRAFLALYYIPANATLTLVGDFDPMWVKKAVAKYFGALPRARSPAPLLYAPTRRAPALSSQLLPNGGPAVVSWQTQSPGALTQQDAAAQVLAKILTAGDGSRLHRELVAGSRLAHSVFAEQHSAGTHSRFIVSAVARPGVPSVPLQSALARALANVCTQPLSKPEVERAKLRAETELVIETQTLAGLAERLQFYDLYAHKPGYLAHELAHYENLQSNDVQRLANELLCAQKTP
jgi:zinc protease